MAQGYLPTAPSYDMESRREAAPHQHQAFGLYLDEIPPTQAPPFFQPYAVQSSATATKGDAHHGSRHSPVDVQSRGGGLTRPNAKGRLRGPVQTSRADKSLKRQKTNRESRLDTDARPTVESNEGCNSDTDSHLSECCSSCSEGLPCLEPDCQVQKDEVVPCTQSSCGQSVCNEPCLSVGIEMQQQCVSDQEVIPSETRLSSWENSAWNPQEPRTTPQIEGVSNNTMIDPLLMCNGRLYYYTSLSASPAPTTPSIADNIQTPFSTPALPTPQYLDQRSHLTNLNNSAGELSGTGTMFDPSAEPWSNQSLDTLKVSSSSSIFDCPWSGCEQVFQSEQDWIPHLHRDHLDPQMSFGCPLQSDTCPETIGLNPLDHLETDHGFNFNFNAGGYSCPAPMCLPGEVFCNPAMLHNHFDHAHALPAQGELHCQLNTCDSVFQDHHQLLAHLNEQHRLLALAQSEEDIDLSVPSSAAILPSIPNVDFQRGGVNLSCKWTIGPQHLCGHVCVSEEDLHRHVREHHLAGLNKQTGYICHWENCDRVAKRGEKHGFTQRGKLERHMATHTGYKSSICDVCNLAFSAPQAMKQHRLLHTGEKPWECKHCGKKFPQQSACTIHERTHTKDKPLQCNVCGKWFSESSNLSKHRKTHGLTGRHPCTVAGCTKSFHRLDQLKRHLASHARIAEKARQATMSDSTMATELEMAA